MPDPLVASPSSQQAVSTKGFDPARMERKLAELERAEQRVARMRGEIARMVRDYSDANGFRVRLSRPEQVLADIAAKERAAA
jgi:hypothetical protein